MRYIVLGCMWLMAVAFAAPNVAQDPPFTHTVSMQIEHGDAKKGEIVLGLFGSVVPKTVENFVQLSTGEHGYGYANTTFHRIINNFMIQGGDIEHKNGYGGYSVYGKHFNDENFIVKHDRPGRLSMANAGPNTQGSQFFITTVVTSWLDGAHVVLGQVTDGLEFLDYLQKVATDEKNNKPQQDVVLRSLNVKKVALDSDANADFFDELKATSHAKTGVFWMVVFGLLGVALALLSKIKRQNLISLRQDVAFNRSD